MSRRGTRLFLIFLKLSQKSKGMNYDEFIHDEETAVIRNLEIIGEAAFKNKYPEIPRKAIVGMSLSIPILVSAYLSSGKL